MLLNNPYIYIPLLAWIVAQWIKFTIAAFKGDINLQYLYVSGGMPSAHSAVVCSLFVTTWLLAGSMSPLVGITGIIAAIVMYDSLGVRRSTGEQAIVLNELVENLEDNNIRFATPVGKVRQVLGHQPGEVFWGALLGVVIAVVAGSSHLAKQAKWLTAVPTQAEQLGHVLALVAVLIGLSGIVIATRKRWKKAASQSGHLLLWLAIATTLAGLFIGLAEYEAISVIGARWVMYVVYAVLALMIWQIMKQLKQLPSPTVKTDQDTGRKDRWLKKQKTKKKGRS